MRLCIPFCGRLTQSSCNGRGFHEPLKCSLVPHGKVKCRGFMEVGECGTGVGCYEVDVWWDGHMA